MIDEAKKRTVDVTIVDRMTGERVTYEDELYDTDDPDADLYIWDEGNYACDCNRALFVARAKGRKDPNLQCGSGRFLVCIRGKDGKLLLKDNGFPD